MLRMTKEPGYALPPFGDDSRWYVAYTNARHEKNVAGQLAERDIECFLPLYQTIHRWKDRYQQLQLPLFPSYVFVRISLQDRLRVLQIAGVVRFVSFNGVPAALDCKEIEALRNGLQSGARSQPHPYLVVGRRVRVVGGALAGMEGIIQRKKDKLRIIISLNLIMRSIAVEVDAADLEWLPRRS